MIVLHSSMFWEISKEMEQPHLQKAVVARPIRVPVPQYSLFDTLSSLGAFHRDAFLFLYHPPTDEFIAISNGSSNNNPNRIRIITPIVARALRLNFPHRFPSQHEFAMVLSTGDMPSLKSHCLGSSSCGGSTVLQFGAVYRDEKIPPMPMISMPMHIIPHLPCYDIWQWNLFVNQTRRVCKYLLARPKTQEAAPTHENDTVGSHGLNIDEDTAWEYLIPQIIWRGTDFAFMGNSRRPDFAKDVAPKIGSLKGDNATRAAIEVLSKFGDKLLPRWKGILLTSQAELEARSTTQQNEASAASSARIPWVNIKFSLYRAAGSKTEPNLRAFQSVGISTIGEVIAMPSHSPYKYQIDLGGGGGTTFTGTIEKLAMPGVLFHHVTKTKDYFHDRLQDWVHYIPVRSNLSDLRENYMWAEQNAKQAKNISEQATAFMKWMGSVEGFEIMYEDHLVDPLWKCVESYQPLKEGSTKSVLDIIKESEQLRNNFKIIANVSGLKSKWLEETNFDWAGAFTT
eukprot:CCRYP_017989-RA/>CCRYP_017989-RA protein AED:0.14 eAED:0.14 QI:0/-1/0/1/-1/1/1/0/510